LRRIGIATRYGRYRTGLPPRAFIAERLRWRMARILFATLGSPMLTSGEIESGRDWIDGALFKKLEKLLGLKSPDIQFQDGILHAIAHYRRCPDPALVDRKKLKALREYFSDVLEHLQGLEKLLPASGQHDSEQSNFLFVIFDQITNSRQRFDYLTFKAALDRFLEVTEAANAKLTKQRVPPNLKLPAVEHFVCDLAEIFRERTGQDPQKHIKSDYTKSRYKGAFFQMANEIL